MQRSIIERNLILAALQIRAQAEVNGVEAKEPKNEAQKAPNKHSGFFDKHKQNNATYSISHPAASVGRKMGHR